MMGGSGTDEQHHGAALTDEHEQTQDALTWADRIGKPPRRRSRWFERYLLVFGVGSLVAVSAMAVLRGPAGMLVFALCWLAFLTGITYYSRRQPGGSLGPGLRHAVILGSWTVCYLAVLAVGLIWFDRVAAWWLAGSVVVSAPCFVGAWLESRR